MSVAQSRSFQLLLEEDAETETEAGARTALQSSVLLYTSPHFNLFQTITHPILHVNVTLATASFFFSSFALVIIRSRSLALLPNSRPVLR